MNPEAVQWLESLSDQDHANAFTPEVCSPGALASFKSDHEACLFCGVASRHGTLVVIE